MFHSPKQILLMTIRLYQRTLSLDHSPLRVLRPYGQCRFYPTCSEYGYQAVERYGVIKGLFLATKRVVRCHPFSKGGNDPISKIDH